MTAPVTHQNPPTPAREDKFIGQDGPIWPVARAAMVDVNAIRKRMAEDVAEIASDRGGKPSIDSADLVYRGWTRLQVAVHGDHAIRRWTEGL